MHRAKKKPQKPAAWTWFWTLVQVLVIFVFLFYLVCGVLIMQLPTHDPPVTMVQVQRRVQALLAHKAYDERRDFIPLARIAPNLKYAVIAAEDERFFVHHGIEWTELMKVLKEDIDKRSLAGRGASTITQQLVKNLFLGTGHSIIRKGVEITLVPLVESVLTKQRILELYLNEIEWGPGVYGAQPAAAYWYRTTAINLTRNQAARLAAILPNPLTRTPAGENAYSEEVLRRMKQMGW